MDYEKKYNEALKWMRELYPRFPGAFKEEVEHYFPQLRESEDEQSYKKIEQLIRLNTSGAEKTRLLAYLEKQKEQKPAEKQDYSGLTDLERAIHRGFLCAGVENVPVIIIKETAQDCLAHMPAWSEEDEMIIDTIISVLGQYINYKTVSGSSSGYATPMYSKEIDWLNSLRPSWKPSEEDERILKGIIGKIDHDQTYGVSKDEMLNFLKKL